VKTNTHLISLAVARSRRLAIIYRRVFPFLSIVSTAGCMMPLGLLYSPNGSIFVSLHYVILGVLIFGLIGTFIIALEVVLHEIRFAMSTQNDTIGDQRRDVMKMKLIQIERQVLFFRGPAFFQLLSGPFSACFGLVPYLTRRSSYMLPFMWFLAATNDITYCLLALRVIFSVSTKASSTNSLDVISGENESDVFPMQGLGIVNINTKRTARWKNKMSRITERSEQSRQTSQVTESQTENQGQTM